LKIQDQNNNGLESREGQDSDQNQLFNNNTGTEEENLNSNLNF